MPQSATDVSNLALALLGDEAILTDVTTDTTKPGKLCRLFLDNTRRSLLRSFPWNFAVVPYTSTLLAISGAANNGSGLIRITSAVNTFVTGNRVAISGVQGTTEANGIWTITVISGTQFDLQASTFTSTYSSGGYVSLNPAFGYLHQHTLPTDLLRLVQVEDDVDYRMLSGVVVTDEVTMNYRYIKEVSDYPSMDALFYNALSYALAIKVCYPLTQSRSLKQQLQEEFQEIIRKARFVDSVEDPMRLVQATEWLNSRDDSSSSFVRDPMTN